MPHSPVRVGRGIPIAFGFFGEDRVGRVQEVNSALGCLAASKPPPDLPVRLELWPHDAIKCWQRRGLTTSRRPWRAGRRNVPWFSLGARAAPVS